jgi:hypothetical protein
MKRLLTNNLTLFVFDDRLFLDMCHYISLPLFHFSHITNPIIFPKYIVLPMFLNNNYLCDEEELMGRIDNLD